ncbi:MAG: DNA polymerase III subunit delta, partial [Myxococcales bacterium]|nr:DNA polymerase III subunit delta [Myxococcales bacterium]
MQIDTLIDKARAGSFGRVHLLLGAERFLIERAIRLLRAAAVGDGIPGFNEDLFIGKGTRGDPVVSAAKTLPMMGGTRFVLVRDVDQMDAAGQALLGEYLLEPVESTCLVLTAKKLDGRGKLSKNAKKGRYIVDAKPLKGGALRSFASAEASARGHRLEPAAAAALVDALGDDLAALDDATERLSLFVGEGRPIDVSAVEACVSRIRIDSIWALVDAVSLRDAGRALSAANSLLGDREPPLK